MNLAITSLAVLLGDLPAFAATISLVPLDGPEDVLNTGTWVTGYNYGESGTPEDATINGVSFLATPTPPKPTPVGLVASDVQYHEDAGTLFFDGDPNLETALNSVVFANSKDSGKGMSIDLTGLTIGDVYRLQVLVADRRTTAHVLRATIAGADSGQFSVSDGTNPALNIVSEFVATAATERFIMTVDQQGAEGAFFAAAALHKIPEPSSLALLALSTVALRRRRV